MIEVVTAEADAARQEAYRARVRGAIRDALIDLRVQLGQFEQKTIGLIGSRTAFDVGMRIADCYDSPGALSVARLYQTIRLFLEGTK